MLLKGGRQRKRLTRKESWRYPIPAIREMILHSQGNSLPLETAQISGLKAAQEIVVLLMAMEYAVEQSTNSWMRSHPSCSTTKCVQSMKRNLSLVTTSSRTIIYAESAFQARSCSESTIRSIRAWSIKLLRRLSRRGKWSSSNAHSSSKPRNIFEKLQSKIEMSWLKSFHRMSSNSKSTLTIIRKDNLKFWTMLSSFRKVA